MVQEEKVQVENDGGEDAAAESPEAGVDVPVEEADNNKMRKKQALCSIKNPFVICFSLQRS